MYHIASWVFTALFWGWSKINAYLKVQLKNNFPHQAGSTILNWHANNFNETSPLMESTAEKQILMKEVMKLPIETLFSW